MENNGFTVKWPRAHFYYCRRPSWLICMYRACALARSKRHQDTGSLACPFSWHVAHGTVPTTPVALKGSGCFGAGVCSQASPQEPVRCTTWHLPRSETASCDRCSFGWPCSAPLVVPGAAGRRPWLPAHPSRVHRRLVPPVSLASHTGCTLGEARSRCAGRAGLE